MEWIALAFSLIALATSFVMLHAVNKLNEENEKEIERLNAKIVSLRKLLNK